MNPVKKTSLFLDLMGDSPLMRVLDYLLTERELDFSITDIACNAHIGRATLYRIWDNLAENKVIKHTRIIGRAKLFKLNTENPKIKKLIEIHDMLVIEELKRVAEKKILVKTRQ
jgi:Fe2+ or Zn2+ uptake regulation protein